MAYMVKIRCHYCWRDPDCDCKGECLNVGGWKHECDCCYCDTEWDIEPESEDCPCACHQPVATRCPRCNNSRYIEYEAIGPGKQQAEAISA